MHKPVSGTHSEINPVLSLRPAIFCVRYVASQPTPYSFSSKHQPSLAGGVLRGGQPVWLEPSVLQFRGGNVQAFADQLGVILLDPRWLLRKDADSQSSGYFGATVGTTTVKAGGDPMKPAEYSETFIVMQDVAYSAIEEDGSQSALRTGMLPVGRQVWLPEQEEQLGEARVMAFAEDVGRIAVSRNSLARKR